VSPPPTPGKVSPEMLRALQEISSVRLFAKGATLFQEGSAVKGVYLVQTGEVRVLLSNAQAQEQLLEIVGPGTMLGLSESLTGENHRITAEASDQTMVAFIPREEFLEFLRQHANFCMEIARRLSEDLHLVYDKFRGISAHPGRPRQRSLNDQMS